MSEERSKVAEAIRDFVSPVDFVDPFPPQDLITALAEIITTLPKLPHPREMYEVFGKAWVAYVETYGTECEAAVKAAIGQQKWQELCQQPNAGELASRLMQHIESIHGEMRPGIAREITELGNQTMMFDFDDV